MESGPVCKTLDCPRCGYDLSGLVGSWQETCPLQGVCSECGLPFDVGQVLNEALAVRWRFVEIAERRRLDAYWQTVRRALWPGAFWSFVRIEYTLRPWRVVRWGALGVLGSYVAAGLVWFVVAIALDGFTTVARPGWFPSSAFELGSEVVMATLAPWIDDDFNQPDLLGVDGLGATFVFMLLGLTVAVVMPMCFMLLPVTLRRAKVRRVHLLRVCAWSLVAPPLLLQALTYGTEGIQTTLYLLTGDYASRLVLLDELHPRRGKVWFVLMLVWLLAWWWAASGRYLRLPRAGLVAAAMVVMSALVVLALSLLVPEMLYYVVE